MGACKVLLGGYATERRSARKRAESLGGAERGHHFAEGVRLCRIMLYETHESMNKTRPV